jgi:uncharacterized membrane protein
VKKVALYALAAFMVFAGLNHFLAHATYVAMVPDVLPWKSLLVDISGIAEMAGGLGLLHPKTRRAAGIGLVLLFLAVFPANINMAVNHLPLGTREVPAWTLWARLPVQALFIAWAWWASRQTGQRERQ